MYGRSWTPAKALGIALLLVCISVMLVWIPSLKDARALPFGFSGLILLGLCVGLPILSLLFLWRAKGIRFVESVLLRVAGLALLASLAYTVPAMKTPMGGTAAIALTLLGAGLLFLAIRALRSSIAGTDFTAAQQVSPEQTRLYLVISAGCLLLFVTLAAWQVISLLVARPTITVDYLAQANKANKSANDDPNRNADPYYEKLLAQFIPPPEALKQKFQSWPTDLSPDELKTLTEWAPVNESALLVLAQAARCPYSWHELKSTDGAMWNIQTPDLDRLRECAWGVLLLAKYRATRGDAGGGLQLLTDLHRFGVHLTQSATLVEQLVGTAICKLDYDAVLALPNHSKLEDSALRSALHALAVQIPLIVVPRFSEVEHLYRRDCIQRLFTDDGKGNGRLIPWALYQSEKRQPHPYHRPISYADTVRICLTHPDRQRTLLSYETCFTLIRELANQTPWGLHVRNTSYEERMKAVCFGNYYLHDKLAATARCIQIGWRTRVSGDATVAILALFACKAEEGRYPQSLRQLVDKELILSVPMDPYSGAPLIYKVKDHNFTLCSVGEDFGDDGGRPCEWNDQSGDHVFWPVSVPVK